MDLLEEIKRFNFLVVDDYESMRILVQEELEALGITSINFATSGNQAFETIINLCGTSSEIQFVITDMMMDNGSGLDLTQNIRKSAKFKDLPILMVSSIAEAGSILNCIKYGIDDYIVKPWDSEELLKKLNHITQKKIRLK